MIFYVTSYFQDGGHKSVQTEKCNRLVSAHTASAQCLCISVRQFICSVMHLYLFKCTDIFDPLLLNSLF